MAAEQALAAGAALGRSRWGCKVGRPDVQAPGLSKWPGRGRQENPGEETIILCSTGMGLVLLQRYMQRLTSGEEGLKIVEEETGIFCSSFPLKIKLVCIE